MSSYLHEYNTSLDNANTMALSCTASEVVTFYKEAEISQFLHDFHNRNTENSHSNLLVLSGGSNVLLPPTLTACVLQPKLTGITLLKEDADYAYVEVMAGENWHDWVLKSLGHGWYGLENMALIPGLVGASPVQNIGAYGVELCDFFEQLTAINLNTGESTTFTKDACQFAYRDSIFKQNPNTWLITKVVFKLHKTPKLKLNYGDVASLAQQKAKEAAQADILPLHVAQAIMEIRQNKLPNPTELANTGSFFKNPVVSEATYNSLQKNHVDMPSYPQANGTRKLPAGWLIDQAGLKGFQIGNIATHTKQALVVVNHAPNQANSEPSSQTDIETFSNHIQTVVKAKYGVQLEREPVWVNADGSLG